MTHSTAEASTSAFMGFDRAAFEAFLETREEPGWVTDLRRQAFEHFVKTQQTSLDPEEWKRVELRAFRPERFNIVNEPQAPSSFETLMQHQAEYAGFVNHIDGACYQESVHEQLASQGVLYGDLSRLLREHGELLRPHLMTCGVKPETDRFSAWHAAFWTGGTLLYVPPGVSVDQPLYSLIALAMAGAADFSHTLVIMGAGSSATLLEETASASGDVSGLHVGAVELLLDREASLRYVQLQSWNENTWHFAHQVGRVEADAALQWTVGGLGARLAHIHQDVNLEGRGATAEVNGVTFAVNRQVISYYTQQSHNAPGTRSDLLYKDVLRDRARVVWRGMIKVDEVAQQTDGYQRNDALLLTPTCRMDAIPGLEIEADDVRCTHGATAGRVDEEQIFYCMCRGLTNYEAMHMIVQGFFQIVSDRIPVELVRETLNRAIERKLGIGEAWQNSHA